MQLVLLRETHQELVERAARWVTKHCRCHVVLQEFKCFAAEIPDVIGFSNYRSVVVECKVSHSDYLADLKKPHHQKVQKLGNLHYYLTLPGLIQPQELVNGWGLLYAQPHKIEKIQECVPNRRLEVKNEEWYLMYSLMRRAAGHQLLDTILKPF